MTILGHTLLGFVVLPLLLIPVHEILHIVPMLIVGAKNIRVGADIKQFMFYVTARRRSSTKRVHFYSFGSVYNINVGFDNLILSLRDMEVLHGLIVVRTYHGLRGRLRVDRLLHEHGKRYIRGTARTKVAYFIAVDESDN